jgi:hypothetical protein
MNTTTKPLNQNRMLGNTLIAIKKFFHQHFFCIHKYKWVYRKDNGSDFEVCEKCDLIRENL